MFKVSSATIILISEDQSESSSFKKREKIKTVQEVPEAVSSVVIKTLKIALLNLFKSERSRLKSFLLQIEMNICFNKLQFEMNADKVLYTAIYRITLLSDFSQC